jgi:hypothetical protein
MNAKKAAPKKPAKATKAPTTNTPPADECPKGGKHTWTEDDDGRTCSKCLEPAPDGKKPTGPAKGAKKAASAKKTGLSAIDAAAKLLSETKEALTTKQMIEQMAAKGLWTSPGGKTPHATLYSAILREINVKGSDSRFKKTERGKFVTK